MQDQGTSFLNGPTLKNGTQSSIYTDDTDLTHTFFIAPAGIYFN